MCRILGRCRFSLLLWVQLLGCVISLDFDFLKKLPDSFPECLYYSTFLPAMHQHSSWPATPPFLSNLWSRHGLIVSILIAVQYYLSVVPFVTSLMARDVWYHFVSSVAVLSLCPLLTLLFGCFSYDCWVFWVVCILSIVVPITHMVCKFHA